jgi:hypothetical protein
LDAERVQGLQAALLTVLIEAGTLARVARENKSPSAVSAQAHSVDAATTGVDQAIEGLGLERCADINVGPQSGHRP